MPTKNLPRRAVVAYLVVPNTFWKFRVRLFGGKVSAKADLGFPGVFGILRSKSQKINVKRSSTQSRDTIQSAELFRFSPELFVLLVEFEKSAGENFWNSVKNPSLKAFEIDIFPRTTRNYKFSKTSAPLIYIAEDTSDVKMRPAIKFENDYVSFQLATRVVITEAIERGLLLKMKELPFSDYNLVRVNRLIHATTQWHLAWASTGKNVPGLIEEFRKNCSKKTNFTDFSEFLKLANSKEQRRIAWAAGTSIAVGNLTAASMSDQIDKWISLPIALFIFVLLYITKPFTRI
jgi:hypothetical protein